MSENPYQSPAEISLADFSAENAADAGPIRWGGLIWMVLLLDSISCLIVLIECLHAVFDVIFLNLPLNKFVPFCLMVGIAISCLNGNILILLKKRGGIPLAVTGIVLSIVNWGVCMWMNIYNSSRIIEIEFELVVVSSFWAGWLILYSFVVWKAAKKLGWLRRNSRSEEQEL